MPIVSFYPNHILLYLDSPLHIYWVIFFIILPLILPTHAKGKSYACTSDISSLYLDNPQDFVTDPNTIIKRNYRDSLNTKMKYLKEHLGTEARILILPCMQPTQPETFAQSIFNNWELKKPKESTYSLLFFFIYREEDVYFCMLTDQKMKKILPEENIKVMQLVTVVPTIRKSGLGAGLYAGVKETIRMLEAKLPVKKQKQQETFSLYQFSWLHLSIGSIFMALFFFLLTKNCKRFL